MAHRSFALLTLALLSCKPAAAPLVTAPSGPAAVLFVSAAAAAGSADGSEAHPFATLSEALAKAPADAIVRIGEGEFRGQLEIRRPVSLVGQGADRTRLVFDGSGAAVEVRAEHVGLSGLSISGGTSCISFHGGAGHELLGVELSLAVQQAILGKNAHLVIKGGAIHDLRERSRGIDLDGGSLDASGVVFRAAGRRAISLHAARGLLTDLDVRGPSLAALQATAGSEVRVVRGVFESLSGAALYAAGGSQLIVEDAVVRKMEYGAMAFRGSELTVLRGHFTDYAVAGIALVNAHGSITAADIARGGTEGAVSITSADGDLPVLVVDNRIHKPGPMGLHVSESAVTARGNSITGARLDREHDMGDALFAIHSQLVVENNVMRGNAGSGVTALHSKVLITGNGFIGNGRAGVLLLDRSNGTGSGNLFLRNLRPVELGEESKAELVRNRFVDKSP